MMLMMSHVGSDSERRWRVVNGAWKICWTWRNAREEVEIAVLGLDTRAALRSRTQRLFISASNVFSSDADCHQAKSVVDGSVVIVFHK
jgi:hypothetical protein